jgi:hypothetical protein
MSTGIGKSQIVEKTILPRSIQNQINQYHINIHWAKHYTPNGQKYSVEATIKSEFLYTVFDITNEYHTKPFTLCSGPHPTVDGAVTTVVQMLKERVSCIQS